MATIIKSIGTAVGRDFATFQAFIDSIPTDVVASGNSYIGEAYNDSEFTAGFNLAGKTTDSTHFITIRCAAGQSFNTNPNRANNPLWYNQANGVGIKSASTSTIINSTVNYTVIDGLQVYGTGNNGYPLAISGTGAVAKNCILVGTPGTNNVNGRNVIVGLNATIIDSLIVGNSTGTFSALTLGGNGGTSTMINCTVVKPLSKIVSTDSPRAIETNYGTIVVKNSAMFGFLNRDISPASFSASDYNATDWNQTPGGTSATHSLMNLTYANQFVNCDNDFRLKAGSDLIDKAVNLSATYSASSQDILGTTRQNPWDIGAFEVAIPATAIAMSGPTLGQTQVASSSFALSANGYIGNAVTVTLSDGGKGGTFTPATVQLVGASPSATFTYTPAQTGDIVISTTNDGALTNPTALTYKSALAATQVSLTPPATAPRAGVQSGNFTVAIDGIVNAAVKVIPNDSGDGGSFNPPFVSLDNSSPSGTFTYVGVSGGVKSIGVSNDASLANPTPVSITEKPPIVANPTPSTTTLVVKSIGAGKDFADLKAFTDYAATFDLTTNKQSLMGELYENQAPPSTCQLSPNNPTNGLYQLYLQAVPGMSVNNLDQGDPTDYGTEGIEVVIGSQWRVSRGAVVQDLRINIKNAAYVSMAGGASNLNPPLLRRCRVKSTSSANALISGEYTSPGAYEDSLLILDDTSTGNLITASSYITAKRCTFVRRGSATGSVISVSNSQNTITSNLLGNNVFINCGAVPVVGLDSMLAANVYNNYTDNVMTTPNAGFTVVTAPGTLVRNTTNDFRPDDAGSLIGNASSQAIDTFDMYNHTRGGAPDVGAIQGSSVNLLPQVTITTQGVNAQSVTVSGTTKYAPTDGQAWLLPDANNPNGAVQQGPTTVTLGDGVFSVQWDNVPGGNYQTPKFTLNNPSGYNRTQLGGEAVTILPVTGSIVAAESAPAVGNAPTVTIDRSGFDNTTFSLSGAVDVQGDASATVQAYIDFADGSPSVGPINANIVGKKWGIQSAGLTGKFNVRLVAVANGKTAPTVNSATYKVVKCTAAILLPVPPTV